MGKSNFVALDLPEYFVNEVSQMVKYIANTITSHSFTPVERQVLHMTLCFLGGALSVDRKKKMTVVEHNIESFQAQFQGKVLEFDEYSLFPQTKRNLIVAKFKCTDLHFTSDVIEFKKSFTAIGAIEEDFFVAHVTLGKLSMAHMDTESIEDFIKNLPPIKTQIEISGCHMC